MADSFETLARLLKPFPAEAVYAILDGRPSPRFEVDGAWIPTTMGKPKPRVEAE